MTNAINPVFVLVPLDRPCVETLTTDTVSHIFLNETRKKHDLQVYPNPSSTGKPHSVFIPYISELKLSQIVYRIWEAV